MDPCSWVSTHGLEAWYIYLKPRVNLPSSSKTLLSRSSWHGPPNVWQLLSFETLHLSKLKRWLVSWRSILKGFVKWFNSVAWQPTKSLEFGPGSPQKASTTRFYLPLSRFFSFDKFYVKPVSIDPAWLSVIKLTRCSLTRLDFQLQVVSTWSSYNPALINPVWFQL